MRSLIVLSLVLIALANGAVALADIPHTISYQGVLRDDMGEIVPDGTYSMTFWLYSAPTGGYEVWGETKPVAVENGVFNVHLGDVVPLSGVTFADPYWLGIVVDGSPVMAPRVQLDSAPYALRAHTVEVGGEDSDWLIDDIFVYRTIGKTGVGKYPSLAILDVASYENDMALRVHSYGEGPSAHFSGGPGMVVEPQLETTGFKMGTGAAEGYVLMCDPAGVASWQPPPAGDDGDWTMMGGNLVFDEPGVVSIGTTVTGGKLTVHSDGQDACEMIASNLADGEQVLEVTCLSADGGVNPYGVVASVTPAQDRGVGGSFGGGYRGVEGRAYPLAMGTGEYTGVYGAAEYSHGQNIGVYGYAAGPDATCFGVVGEIGHPGYAGYFVGDVFVVGDLDATSKSFRIDHPLDPAGKYLRHACVESDERKNVYDGIAELDADGRAEVLLPRWFEALNGDFRYQLTCIGGFAPVYVAEKIENGRFTIAGGEPGMEVCWQVTGVRRDAYARANEFVVELEKTGAEVGTYLTPELHGAPASARPHGFGAREDGGE
jgi:hypothetical protein